MIPASFDYIKVKTVDDALAALSHGEGKLLAGGHSLIPAMKLRLNRPTKLIDIAALPELRGIKEEDGEIVIGAAVTHGEIVNDKLLQNKLPFFTKAAALVGDVQVRNYGTIGGSLAHADPAADWPALVLAADAGLEVQSSNGKRRIQATDFFTGLFATTLQEAEIITAIRVPIPVDGTKTSYQKFEQPASGFAIVGCAVMRFPDGRTNIAFTGVSEHAFRDRAAENEISGKQLNDDSIAAVIKIAAEGITVLGDNFASEEYRKHLAKMYLKKALFAVI